MDGTAIVIGAGMGGLTAARVLSQRYDSVVVLDRDELPGDATPRRGVPQSEQLHLLLAGGLRELETLFPGIEAELIAAGGVPIDGGSELMSYRFGSRWPAVPTGLCFVSVTRPTLEGVIRARVAALPGDVTISDQTAVSGLAGSDGTVTGVVLDDGSTLDADLVVDSTGRGSRSDRWLAALGMPAPEQVEVKVGISYCSRLYQRKPGDLPDSWKAAFVLPTPPGEKLMGVALPVEGDRWQIATGGWHLADPPTDVASFEEAIRKLPDPMIADLIATAEPIDGTRVAKFPASRRRLFEKLDRLPSGYVAVGDAVCSFNPVYGQGMTCAAMEATALGTMLDEGRFTPRDFYAAAAKILETPWQLVVGGDFDWPETTGPRPSGRAFASWFARQIAFASQVDPEVNATFQRVQHLLAPMSALSRPGFMLRVMRGARKRKSSAPSQP